MSRISKIEFTEIDRSLKNKYILYTERNNYYIEYKTFSSLNSSCDKALISSAEYETIINHLQKYYKILTWENVYESKDFTINKNEWSITIYENNLIKKEIVGNNNFPKNYNSFKNYFINKFNTLKIKNN